MPRTEPRPRHEISPRLIPLLKVIGFRYSLGRDAYVLRIVGNRVGPVYRERDPLHGKRDLVATNPK